MKRYNMIKNLMIASATATLYFGWILDGVDTFKKIFATVCIFALIFLLMHDADRAMIREAQERRRKKVEEDARETA